MITITEEKYEEFISLGTMESNKKDSLKISGQPYSESMLKSIRNYLKPYIGTYENDEALLAFVKDRCKSDGTYKSSIQRLDNFFVKFKFKADDFKLITAEKIKTYTPKVLEVPKIAQEKEPLLEKLEEIKDTNNKLILHLYLTYDVLRSDFFKIKYKDFREEDTHRYIDGKFVITKSVKKNTPVKDIILRDDTIKLIEENIKEDNYKVDGYIFKMNVEKEENRKKNYERRIKEITERNLGVRMGINDLRKMDVNDYAKSISHLSEEEKKPLMKEKADRNNHSIKVQQIYYINQKTFEEALEEATAQLKILYNKL